MAAASTEVSSPPNDATTASNHTTTESLKAQLPPQELEIKIPQQSAEIKETQPIPLSADTTWKTADAILSPTSPKLSSNKSTSSSLSRKNGITSPTTATATERPSRNRTRQNRTSIPPPQPSQDSIPQLPTPPASAPASTPAPAAATTTAPANFLDRRTSTRRPRPTSLRIEGGLSTTAQRTPRGGGFGPNIPIVVDIAPSPTGTANGGLGLGMAGETVDEDSFEDAREVKSENASVVNLLEGGNGTVNGNGNGNGNGTAMSNNAATSQEASTSSPPPAVTLNQSPPTTSSNTTTTTTSPPQIASPTLEPTHFSTHLSPDLGPIDRYTNRSPSPLRSRSPPKLHRNISSDYNLSTSLAQSQQLARQASTRIAGFFRSGTGTIRKATSRSPSAGATVAGLQERSMSIASVASGGEGGMPTIEDSSEETVSSPVDGGAKRPTLQDQFQTLRRQAEKYYADFTAQPEGVESGNEVLSRAMSDVEAGGAQGSTAPALSDENKFLSELPAPLNSPSLPDPDLPPGTALGLKAGPDADSRPVDWDLWQAVIYEGPSAVARTSGEELNRAIAGGIPAAVRGVVWQVLADSKNLPLEEIYRSLKARGTAEDDEIRSASAPSRPAMGSRSPSQTAVPAPISDKFEKESDVASSRSSVHSEQSTPATSSSFPPSLANEETNADLKATLLAEKAKRDNAAAHLLKLEKAIKRDLGSRTSFSKYAQAAGLQEGLFGLCKAYALFDEGVGYAQGINFIAMPLLFNMGEEEAFTLLVRLMNRYEIRGLFAGDMGGLHLRLYQFERLLEERDAQLCCHLRRRKVEPQLYATQWFLTLFAYRFPLQLVLRVYDLLFSEGLVAILKFGLVLMERNRETLLQMGDMSHLTSFLKEKLFDVYIDKSPSASSLLDSGFFGYVTGGADKELYRADDMVRDACSIEISEASLAVFAAEYEDQTRLAQEKFLQTETLRLANLNLSARVKQLEDRTQAQDAEHVQLTQEFVRNKVELDRYLDENEVLRTKVLDLTGMVATQAAEVEARYKLELEEILVRNGEVQGENRVLREEVEELEGALVGVKMRCAETQADYDALNQKWSNLQAMLNAK